MRVRLLVVDKFLESDMAALSGGVRHYLLKGYTDSLPVIQSRVIRIFISSNFYGSISTFVWCFCFTV